MSRLCFSQRGRATLVCLSLVLAGCSGSVPEMAPPPPPAVTVSYPLERQVVDASDFTGRTAAVESVQVRARVWGHLESIHFAEGAEVKKGDLLFIIDQRPHRAALARAEADVAQAEARLKRLETDAARARELIQTRAISREDHDRAVGDLAESQAAIRSVRAARDTARLNLDYTEIRAPISGQTGRAHVTVGNLVQSGEMGGTVLTTIVSVDPVHAYFDVDDITLNRVRSLVRNDAGGRTEQADARAPLYLGLAHEEGRFPHRGHIDFMDNQVDPNTGTYKVRGLFDNKERELLPGQFVRIRVPLGQSHRAVLITDRAVDTDQGQKIVFVVNPDNTVEKRLVILGGLHDGLREVISGVHATDRIIVDGIQRVRSGITVVPQLVDLPVPVLPQRSESNAGSAGANGRPRKS